MSHFSLIVALPGNSDVETELADRLAPYDENESVDPYPSYEDGTAADHWWYKSLKGDAEAVANNDHSSIRPYNPNMIGWSSAESRKTPDEQWAEMVRDAEVYNSLPDPVTWPALVDAHNRYYCHGEPHSDGERLYYEPETDRAFTYSTYNPKSKWDYWRIGGRWGRYFPLKEDVSLFDSRLIRMGLSWEWRDTPADERPSASNVEGGPKGLLDLEGLRDAKEKEAAKDYDEFWEFASAYPSAKSWQTVLKECEHLGDGYVERAREIYRSQPLVAAMNEHRKYRTFWGSPLDEYSGDREEFLAKARRDAVPGYALLTLEREWLAPGEMGWFGMSSDDETSQKLYKEKANEYLDSLDDDVILVALDLHI